MEQVFGEKVAALMDERGVTQAELAAAIGARPQNVHMITSTRQRSSKWAPAIADYFGVALDSLLDPKAPITPSLSKKLDKPSAFDVTLSDGPSIRSLVPMISWVQAGQWHAISDTLAPGDAEDWVPCSVACGPRTFALRVRGVSMEPDLREGEEIYVDPDVAPRHGSIVVVRLDGRDEATVKKLVIENGQMYLRASNPAWPEPILHVNEHATICGVVVYAGRRF